MKKRFGYLALYSLAFGLSWLITFSLASVSHTQVIVNNLNSIGAGIRFSERISMTLFDWNALLGSFGNFIFMGMVFAFIFTLILILVLRKFPKVGHLFLLIAVMLAIGVVLFTGQYLWGALAFIASFGIWLARAQEKMDVYLFPLAGATSIATVLFSAQHLWGIVPFAGARDFGLIFQLASGALGGYVFIVLLHGLNMLPWPRSNP